MRADSIKNRAKTQRQLHLNSLDDAFDKFERFERRVDGLEGELDAMALGREKTGLAAEIDALASDDALNDELEALRQVMKTEEATSSTSQ
jgi:phage shock protein A